MTDRAPTPLHVYIATPFGAGGRGGIDRMMDALVASLAARHDDVVPHLIATHGGSLLAAPWRMTVALGSLVALRLRRRSEVVHLNVAQRGSVARKAMIAALARLLGIPYVVHLHGSRFAEHLHNDGPLLQWITRGLFQHAGRVVVLGEVWREIVVDAGLALPANVVVLPNATAAPAARAETTTRPLRLLFLGQLGERKGTPQLLQALMALAPRADWFATLAGDGDTAEARRVVAAAGLESSIHVPGWVDGVGATELLQQADILVLPSFAENLPMSVIEGMAHGLAVVTTPVGAIPDIIRDGVTGILVAPGDVAGLTAALARLLDDNALRVGLGRAASEYHRSHLELGIYARVMTKLWRDVATVYCR